MPKGYWIARVDVRDAEGYKDYVAAAKLAFDRFGVKFLARGGRGDTRRNAISLRTRPATLLRRSSGGVFCASGAHVL